MRRPRPPTPIAAVVSLSSLAARAAPVNQHGAVAPMAAAAAECFKKSRRWVERFVLGSFSGMVKKRRRGLESGIAGKNNSLDLNVYNPELHRIRFPKKTEELETHNEAI